MSLITTMFFLNQDMEPDLGGVVHTEGRGREVGELVDKHSLGGQVGASLVEGAGLREVREHLDIGDSQ